MTACNARPPEGHPLHGTLVACHLASEHVLIDEPHSWEIEAALALHENVMAGLDRLKALFPERVPARIETQLPHPLMVYDVDSETGQRVGQPYRMWELPAGPWVLITYADGEEFAIWKSTGQVYRVGADGAVQEDPL